VLSVRKNRTDRLESGLNVIGDGRNVGRRSFSPEKRGVRRSTTRCGKKGGGTKGEKKIRTKRETFAFSEGKGQGILYQGTISLNTQQKRVVKKKSIFLRTATGKRFPSMMKGKAVVRHCGRGGIEEKKKELRSPEWKRISLAEGTRSIQSEKKREGLGGKGSPNAPPKRKWREGGPQMVEGKRMANLFY